MQNLFKIIKNSDKMQDIYDILWKKMPKKQKNHLILNKKI